MDKVKFSPDRALESYDKVYYFCQGQWTSIIIVHKSTSSNKEYNHR